MAVSYSEFPAKGIVDNLCRPRVVARASEAMPHMKHPWNLGVKVDDLDAELGFLERCGATQIQKGTITTPKGDEPCGLAFLGEQRLLLFPRVIYQDALAEPMKGGLAHAVFQVDDVDDVIERYGKRGVAPMWGPRLF